MNIGDLNKVWEIKTLKRKAGEDEAMKMLERIAKQVQPLMRKHNWRVKLLSEFCPSNPALLGLNVGGGIHVKLRLRRPNRDWDFFPYDQVLDTMLHELCHNAHGPHNASFYKLWDELRQECEELISKGITGTGQGFDLPGKRLGGFSRQPSLSLLRQTALSAAENRAKLGSLLPSGPKRLGGDSSIMASLSPIQAAAMAAERRLQDEIWCASLSSGVNHEDLVHMQPSTGATSLNGDRKRSRKSSCICDLENYIDLSADALASESVSDLGTNSKRRNLDKNQSSDSAVPTQHGVLDLTTACSPSNACTKPDMWECGMCTLLNPPLAPVCKLCNAEKSKDINTKYKTWSCKFCTLENSVKLDRCSACDEWRYSNGLPVATRAPNVGT